MFKKLNTFKYTRHGDFLNVVKPVGLEKGPEVELASAEYVLVLVQGIWFKPSFALEDIVSYIKNTTPNSINNISKRYTTV